MLFNKNLNQKLKKDRGMVLGMVLIICLILGIFGFEAEKLALHAQQEASLVKRFSQEYSYE